MTPADRRMTELIDKWLASIDLHLAYAELSDAAYARVQQWPKHDRPTKWVLEVARQKIVELKSHCETRQAMGDGRFAESLELMAFLANLVGIQHIQRFIPLADPAHENKATANPSSNSEASTVIRPLPHATVADDSTREMPKLKTAVAAAEPAKSPKRTSSQTSPPQTSSPASTQASPQASPQASSQTRKTEATELPGISGATPKIIADAIRLLKWGKPWHELAELIARIADRPSTADIRKVLRAHKAEIEAKAEKDG